MTKIESFTEYNEKVLDYLEYLEFDEMILEFEPADVARSIFSAASIFYMMGLSFRKCALSIYGLTMTYQIMPSIKGQKVH